MSGLNYISSEQFLGHKELAGLKALDFPGHVGDPDPVGRMEKWQSMFGGTGEARHYDEGDNPTAAVSRMREQVRASGVERPIQVNEWGNGQRTISDGHHRAVAAYLEGQGAPAHIKRYPDIGKD